MSERGESGAECGPVKRARSWRHRTPVSLRYAAAVLLVCAAEAFAFTLQSEGVPSLQTPFFICAIVLSSWVGGFGPGVFATLLSVFAVDITFTDPVFTLPFTWQNIPKYCLFFFTGAFISWLAQRQRRDEEALFVARENLEEKVRQRTRDLFETNERLTVEVGERIRAEAELQRLNRAWRVRSVCNRSVARSTDEGDFLQRVCQAFVKAGAYPLTWVAYAGGPSGLSRAALAVKPGISHPESASAPDGCGHHLATGAILDGRPASRNRRSPAEDKSGAEWADSNGFKAIIALPLIPDGTPIGSLLVYSDEWEAFDAKEAELLQQAANDIAQGIVLMRSRLARARAEETLKKTQSELARVARITTMGELTASIAHEINQPLAALVTNASACVRWLAADSPNLEEARATAQRLVRDGRRAADVIARIRSLLGKGTPERQRLNINNVVEELLPVVNGELRQRQATLRTEFADGLPDTELDRVQIQQLLMNLIVNALDAMNEVNDRPHLLEIRTAAEASGVCVAVTDSGAGLKPEQLDRLFDAFYSTKSHGMGMGLSISRSIIEAHGGRLWVEANDGYGATFRFTLPAESRS